MNVGVLSTSSIVPRFIRAFRENGEGRILAVASRSAEKAAAFARDWDIPKSFGSYEALLDDPEIDLAYVAMVSGEHFRFARMALEKGKHVLCEKPFVLRKSEAEELFALAREKGLFLAEAQKAVFLPVMEAVRERIRSGAVGRIRMADFTSSFPGSYNSWLTSRSLGGGALYSNAGYTVALSRFLFGCPVADYTGLCTKGGSDADEQCAIALCMADDTLVTGKISTDVAAPGRAVFYGEKGRIEIPDYWKARTAFVFPDGQEPEEIRIPCEHELIYEIRHFLACIREGRLQSPVMDEAMTVGTVAILEDLARKFGVGPV